MKIYMNQPVFCPQTCKASDQRALFDNLQVIWSLIREQD